MTGPDEGHRDDPHTPQQPAWNPPWEPPPAPSAADYPRDYRPLNQPTYPPPQFGPPPGAYYPPPDYPGGWGPAQPVRPPGTNGLAIASLVTAFVGFLCCIGSIAAIVLGIVALDQIRRTRQEGHGLAVAGIALGVAGLVMILIIWIVAAAVN